MSLASTGLHKLDAWSPWKLSNTAHFCSCFCFRKCIHSLSNSMISINLMLLGINLMPYGRWYGINLMHGLLGCLAACTARFFFLFLFSTTLFGTNLMRLPWHQPWFLTAIMFCDGFCYGLLSPPFLTLILVITQSLYFNHVCCQLWKVCIMVNWIALFYFSPSGGASN